jgi:hypothetical protein
MIVSFNQAIAQRDTSRARWFREYYASRYLQDVLNKKQFNYSPPNGVVPDSSAAILIAETVLSKVYGEIQIAKEKPFTAILAQSYWIVYGNLPYDIKPGEVTVGGVAEIVIRKSNGEVINISHGK